jgi:penicillin-binding protein 1C
VTLVSLGRPLVPGLGRHVRERIVGPGARALGSHGRRRLAGVVGGPFLLLAAFWALVPVVQFDDPLSTVILDRGGALLGASIADDEQWRFGVGEAVPEKFVAAITCAEDHRFFHHPGVDPLALARAFVQNVRQGRVVSGGSTLTMQVVRLARRGRPRTYVEKAIEAVLALRLTVALSKAQVLALYAAYAPFGGNTVGLDAAAWRYFGRSARRLSWAETAALAVLPNAPSLVHPGRNRERLLRKRNRLLDRLLDEGLLDAMTADLAKEEPVPPEPAAVPRLAPHLLERIRAEKAGAPWRTGEASPWVRTTLDAELQVRASAAVERHHRALAENGVQNAAALIADVDSGRILAYVGNVPLFDAPDEGDWVDVVPAPRSTGSILKPLLFAAMLDSGEILPGQLVPDVPTHVGSFHPENFDRSYAGAVPAEQALARSLNVPAVRLLRAYGTERFTALLRRVGLTTLDQPAAHYGLSLILGGAEGTLFDVAGVYAGLGRIVNRAATGVPLVGAFHPLTYFAGERVRETDGEPPLGPGAAWLTLQAMLEVERPGDELAWRAFSSSRRIAWKTGTSYGYRDAWAIGVTPRHVVGVWVGNADGEGRPGLTGHSAAAPLLFDLFGLLPGHGWFEEPVGSLVDVEVCARSGMRRGPHCALGRFRLVTKAALDSPPCAYCRLAHLDSRLTWQVHGDCERIAAIRTIPWFSLPPAMETYYRLQHAEYRPLPPLRPDCRADVGSGGSGALAFVSPREGAIVYVPIELDGSLGRVVFEAAHRDPDATVYWHLDGEYEGETRDLHQMALAPPPGRHVLTLVDETGETVQRRFTVLGREGPRARGRSK